MKKGIFGLFLLIILFSFSVAAQVQNGGVTLCGVEKNCGLVDEICPEDFFEEGVSCYELVHIEDPDCCKIIKAGWSSSPDQYTAVTEAAEGQSIYMFVETTGCSGKDAEFTIYAVDERLFGADTLLASETAGPFAVDQSNKVAARWVAFTDPAAFNDGITKFKFKVKINPELFSDIIKVSLIGGGASVNSCNDGIDNDADGCADEEKDCEDGQETNQDYGECAVCTTENGIYTCSACTVRNWKCNPGDCLEGKKATNCPALPPNCPLTQPPKFVKCYEKTIPFPFYDNFNLILSVFSLIGYYVFSLRKKIRLV